MRSASFILVGLAVLLVGCGGKDLVVGYNDSGLDSSINPDPNAPVDLSAVAARCQAPSGPTVAYTGGRSFLSMLTGRWFLCSTSESPGVLTPQAIEFTSDQQWFLLVPDDTGRYLRTADPSGHGAFTSGKVISTGPDEGYISLDGANDIIVEFETAPLRMQWTPNSSWPDGPPVALYTQG